MSKKTQSVYIMFSRPYKQLSLLRKVTSNKKGNPYMQYYFCGYLYFEQRTSEAKLPMDSSDFLLSHQMSSSAGDNLKKKKKRIKQIQISPCPWMKFKVHQTSTRVYSSMTTIITSWSEIISKQIKTQANPLRRCTSMHHYKDLCVTNTEKRSGEGEGRL